MAIQAKQLANGQLPNAAAALYTAPASTVTYIKNITLHNTNSVTRTCTLWFKEAVTGSTRIIIYVKLKTRYTFPHPVAVVLDAGDSIWGEDDSAASDKVDYVISGAEES